MELNTVYNEGPAAPSATVVLLRDGPHDLEVFLLQRHGQSDVLGGAYVFPGGKVDPEDAEWVERLDTSALALHARLGEPELSPPQAAGLFVTAIRELFEETGLLLADVTPQQARKLRREQEEYIARRNREYGRPGFDLKKAMLERLQKINGIDGY